MYGKNGFAVGDALTWTDIALFKGIQNSRLTYRFLKLNGYFVLKPLMEQKLKEGNIILLINV